MESFFREWVGGKFSSGAGRDPFFSVVEPVRNCVSPSPAIQRFRSGADNATPWLN